MEIVSCGRWPEQCPEELRVHIAACAICGDVLEVALALHEDRGSVHAHAQIPSADLMWWRAELRARQEAVRKASRPISFVAAFGAASAVGVVVALLSSAWPWLERFLVVPDLSALSFTQLAIVIAFAVAILVIAPLAMYLVLSDE
jgi:hypothetical protein